MERGKAKTEGGAFEREGLSVIGLRLERGEKLRSQLIKCVCVDIITCPVSLVSDNEITGGERKQTNSSWSNISGVCSEGGRDGRCWL